MMIKTKLFLELLISMFYPVSFMVEPGQVNSRQALGHIAEKVAQFYSAFVQMSAFNQEPDVLMVCAVTPPMSRPYPDRNSFYDKRLVPTVGPDLQALPSVTGNTRSDFRDLDRRRVRCN